MQSPACLGPQLSAVQLDRLPGGKPPEDRELGDQGVLCVVDGFGQLRRDIGRGAGLIDRTHIEAVADVMCVGADEPLDLVEVVHPRILQHLPQPLPVL